MNKQKEVKVILSTVNILDMNNDVEEFKKEYAKSWRHKRICIDRAFDWEESDKGYDYWHSLCLKEELYTIYNSAHDKVVRSKGIYLFLSEI